MNQHAYGHQVCQDKKSNAIVVSPLPALMQDQVQVFYYKGISSASISSDTNFDNNGMAKRWWLIDGK